MNREAFQKVMETLKGLEKEMASLRLQLENMEVDILPIKEIADIDTKETEVANQEDSMPLEISKSDAEGLQITEDTTSNLSSENAETVQIQADLEMNAENTPSEKLYIPTELKEVEKKSPINIPSDEKKEAEKINLNEKWADQYKSSQVEKLANAAVEKIRSHITLNLKIALINRLYNGELDAFQQDLEWYEEAGHEAANQRFEEVARQRNWDPEDEIVEQWRSLIQRRWK